MIYQKILPHDFLIWGKPKLQKPVPSLSDVAR